MNKKLISFTLSAALVAGGVAASEASASFSGFKTEGGAALSEFTFASDVASTTYTADLSGMTNMELSFVFDDLADSAATTAVYKNRPTITIGGKTIVVKPQTNNQWNSQWPGTSGVDNGLYGICWKPYTSAGNSPLTLTITAELSGSTATSLTVTASNVSGSKTISFDTATDVSTIYNA